MDQGGAVHLVLGVDQLDVLHFLVAEDDLHSRNIRVRAHHASRYLSLSPLYFDSEEQLKDALAAKASAKKKNKKASKGGNTGIGRSERHEIYYGGDQLHGRADRDLHAATLICAFEHSRSLFHWLSVEDFPIKNYLIPSDTKHSVTSALTPPSRLPEVLIFRANLSRIEKERNTHDLLDAGVAKVNLNRTSQDLLQLVEHKEIHTPLIDMMKMGDAEGTSKWGLREEFKYGEPWVPGHNTSDELQDFHFSAENIEIRAKLHASLLPSDSCSARVILTWDANDALFILNKYGVECSDWELGLTSLFQADAVSPRPSADRRPLGAGPAAPYVARKRSRSASPDPAAAQRRTDLEDQQRNEPRHRLRTYVLDLKHLYYAAGLPRSDPKLRELANAMGVGCDVQKMSAGNDVRIIFDLWKALCAERVDVAALRLAGGLERFHETSKGATAAEPDGEPGVGTSAANNSQVFDPYDDHLDNDDYLYE